MAHHQVKASHLIQILEASRGIGGSAVEGLKIGHPRQFKQQRFGAAVKKNPLPCFPLYPEHIGILSTRSNNHELDQCKNRLLQDSVTPTEFHQHLCKSIQNAKRRVKLATLYIGAGNGCMSNQKDKTEIASSKEEELLLSLQHLSNHSTTDDNNDIEIKILMDASRGLRPINIMYQTNNEKDYKSATSNIEEEKIAMTSSAREVYYSLFPNGKKESNNKGISLFNVHSGLWSYMPSPINEIFGVFHLKVYIIDDELILSGANLSEEYFTDRLDRYISFVKGANGLVDFYSDLIDILYEHSTEFSDPVAKLTTSQFNEGVNKELLSEALNRLFDGTRSSLEMIENENLRSCNKSFAFAIPTLQPSEQYVTYNRLTFEQDINVTRDLLSAIWNLHSRSSVHLSSAYLNPTAFLMSVLEKFGSQQQQHEGAAYLLSAAPTSHGFKPKKMKDGVNGSGRDFIPSVFMRLAEQINEKIMSNGGRILLYEKNGHTFHAKGLWVTSNSSCSPVSSIKNVGDKDSNSSTDIDSCKIIKAEHNLVASIIGSSNFGSRSETLDWESNCILVMNPNAKDEKSVEAKSIIASDWNNMLEHSVQYGSREDLKVKPDLSVSGFVSHAATKIASKYF